MQVAGPTTTIGITPAQGRRLEARVARFAGVVLFASLAIIVSLPLFSRDSWLIFVQDDFLYYLKVAQNIAHGHGSTFNGIVPTNGYQPLWLILLVALSFFSQSPQVILGFLAATTFVAALLTFFFAAKLLRTSGARPLLVFSLAAYITVYSVTLFFYGMEVTLAVPLILGVVCLLLRVDWLVRSPKHTFLLGLLLSAMVLARIDTLILGGLLLVGILGSATLRRQVRPGLVVGAALGLVPLAIYFYLNHRIFLTWLPISGMAKELRHTHHPSIEPWRVFFHPLAGAYAALLIAAICVCGLLRKSLTPISRVVFSSILLFPFLYYFILSCVSDWTLWGWYMYPLRTAICVAFLLFCLWEPSRRLLEHPVVLALLLATVFGSVAVLRWRRQQTDIYAASVEVQEFARSHPGIYAMGDRSGRVAYLIAEPVVQTEGLMMDRDYLELVQRALPLREVLARYHVRYYIGTAYAPFTGCFAAGEPAKSGPASAKLRATFCEPPQAHFQHDGVQTLIYDLSTKDNSAPRP